MSSWIQLKFSWCTIPKTKQKCVKIFWTTGFISEGTRTYNGHVLTIETLRGASSPRRLLIRLAQQTGTCIIGTMCNNTGAFSPTVIKKNEFQKHYETDFEARLILWAGIFKGCIKQTKTPHSFCLFAKLGFIWVDTWTVRTMGICLLKVPR